MKIILEWVLPMFVSNVKGTDPLGDYEVKFFVLDQVTNEFHTWGRLPDQTFDKL